MAKEKDAIPAIAGLTFEQLQACLVAGATLEQVQSLADGGFSYEQILTLAGTLGTAKAAGGGISAADLKEVLQAQRKAMKPENEAHPGFSVFSYPEGEQARPKAFVRDVFFNGLREKVDSLSATETDLYNRFTADRVARGGMWKATIKRNGSSEELWVTTEPKTLDGRMSLPPLTQLLRELLDGEAAADPDALAQRVEDLEARLKALTVAA